MVKKLQDRVEYYMNGLVPPLKKPADPKANETAQERGYWGPWRSSSTGAVEENVNIAV